MTPKDGKFILISKRQQHELVSLKKIMIQIGTEILNKTAQETRKNN